MNELICAVIIVLVTFILGGFVYAMSKLIPNIKGFIKWQIFRFSKDDWDNED